jgi:hypothetical protein
VPAPPTPAGNNSIAAVATAAAPVDNNVVGAVLGHIAPLLQSTTTTVTKLQASVEELSARLPPAGQQHLTAQKRAAFPDEWQNLLNAEITRLSVVAGVPFQHPETTHAYGTVKGHSIELQTLLSAAERLRAITEHMDAEEAAECLYDGLGLIQAKLRELTNKAIYQAAITAETDTLGTGFAPFAQTKLETTYDNDHLRAHTALTDTIKGYRGLHNSSSSSSSSSSYSQSRVGLDRERDHYHAHGPFQNSNAQRRAAAYRSPGPPPARKQPKL